MLNLNRFQIEACFDSEAGPLWICRQVFERQAPAQVLHNPQIAFWRNDVLRKPKYRGSYCACWIDQGSLHHGIFLFLFTQGFLPWIGAYQVMSHLHDFDIEEGDEEIKESFDPKLARIAQAKQLGKHMPALSFQETYGVNSIHLTRNEDK